MRSLDISSGAKKKVMEASYLFVMETCAPVVGGAGFVALAGERPRFNFHRFRRLKGVGIVELDQNHQARTVKQ